MNKRQELKESLYKAKLHLASIEAEIEIQEIIKDDNISAIEIVVHKKQNEPPRVKQFATLDSAWNYMSILSKEHNALPRVREARPDMMKQCVDGPFSSITY